MGHHVKLNIGCGDDYREGYVNIDGNEALPRVDKIIDLSKESLLSYFSPGSVDCILANDVLEHVHHWEAVRWLREFQRLLKPTGVVEIRVPDTEYILCSSEYPLEKKITMLYGGQDVPQGTSQIMDSARLKHPEYYCHRYGWTQSSITKELHRLGFDHVETERAGMNMVVKAYVN